MGVVRREKTGKRLVRRCGVVLAAIASFLGGSATFPEIVSAQNEEAPDVVVRIVQIQQTRNRGAALVTVQSRRGGRGTLESRSAFSESGERVSVAIELPPATSASIWIPFSSRTSESVRVQVRLRSPERVVVAQGNAPATSLAVAVLPGAAGARPVPDVTETAVQTGTAQLSALELDGLERSPAVLEAFAVLAVTTRDLSALSEATRQRVFAWVRRGGELLVDDDGKVPGVSVEVPTTSDAGVPIGSGSVRRTLGVARAGEWRRILLPVPAQAGRFDDVEERAIQSTSRRLRYPPGGLLLLGLIGYVVVVGPVLFGRLRRRRPMTVWVAAPLVALLTTGLVVGVGRVSRQDEDIGAALVESGEGTSWGYAERFLSEGGGRRIMTLPEGWSPVSLGATFGDSGSNTLAIGSPSRYVVEVPPGGVRTIGLAGPVAVPRPLDIEATVDPGNPSAGIVGSVVNRTDDVMSELVVVIGDAAKPIGDLGPGERATFAVSLEEWESPVAFDVGRLGTISAMDAAVLARRSGLLWFADGGEVVVLGRAPALTTGLGGTPNDEARFVMGIGNVRGRGNGSVRTRTDRSSEVRTARHDVGELHDGDRVVALNPENTVTEVWTGESWEVVPQGVVELPREAVTGGAVFTRIGPIPLRIVRAGEQSELLDEAIPLANASFPTTTFPSLLRPEAAPLSEVAVVEPSVGADPTRTTIPPLPAPSVPGARP